VSLVARRIQSGLAAIVVALAVASLIRTLGDPNPSSVTSTMWGLAYVALGCFLLVRRAPTVIAWLITGIGVCAIYPSGSDGVHDLGYRVGVILFLAFGCSSALLGYLFPTGRPMPGGWRWPVIALVTCSTLLIVGQAVGISVDGASSPVNLVVGAIVAGYASTAAFAVPAIIVRYVRAAGVERAQLKWFSFALVMAVVLWSLPVVTVLAPFPPVIAMVVGMTKHHLYDIDRIISRTASYAIVTGAVVGLYALVVTTMGRLLPTSSTLAVAVATLAAAAAARPLLRRGKGSLTDASTAADSMLNAPSIPSVTVCAISSTMIT